MKPVLAALVALAACGSSSAPGSDDFGRWLADAGASAAEEQLRSEGFDSVGSMLEVALNEADMAELGLPMKARKMLAKALAAEAACADGEAHGQGERRGWLVRRQGVLVGHRQRWALEGRSVGVETLSLQPLVFRLEGYLLEGEAEAIIAAARDGGPGLHQGGTFSTTKKQAHPSQWQDRDGDGLLSAREVMFAADQLADGHFTEEDIVGMVAALGMDRDGDGVLDKRELRGGPDGAQVAEYLAALLAERPARRSRLSELAWLDASDTPVVKDLGRRMAAVLQLPGPVSSLSSKMQAVRYGPEGQYTAHLDSGVAPQPRSGKAGALPCCHLAKEDERKVAKQQGAGSHDYRPVHDCRLCRFATLLYSLNDVAEGGATVFPLAGNASLAALDSAATAAAARPSASGRIDPLPGGRLTRAIDEWRVGGTRESEYCSADGAGLRVAPRKGSALLFFNHHLRPDGSLGPVDYLSLHGGCRVLAGEKWIANHWVEASEDPQADRAAADAL